MDRRKYSFYTLRAGIPHQTGARHHCGQRPLICLAPIGDRRRGLGSQTPLTNPFPGLSAACQRPFYVGLDLMLPQSPNRPETANHLFPQACVDRGSFPRAFTPLSPSILRAFTPHLHVVRQVEDLQVVRAAEPVDKINRTKTGRKQPQTNEERLRKGAVLQSSGSRRTFKGLGIAKRYNSWKPSA